MTEQQRQHLYLQKELIFEYMTNISVDVDNLYYDDITMTDENEKEIIKGMVEWAYKLGFAVEDLKKQLNKVVAE